MGRLTERIISLLVVLFLLVYVGYQAYRYYYNPVSTETVYEYNVSRSVMGEGIAIRDEMVLDESVRGVENYLYDDATRITVGEPVAEFYRSSSGDRDVKRSRELEAEIRLLREAQEGTVANIGNAESYNRDIKEQVGRLSVMSSAGRYQGLADMRSSLTVLVNKKQVSTGKVDNYNSRIETLERELEGLGNAASTELIATANAPVSGYFSRTVDGYENRLSAGRMTDYTLDDYLRLLDAQPPAGVGGKVGKMVLSQNWYFAVAVPKADIEWVVNGRRASLQFDQVANRVPATLAKVFDHRNNETAVMLFRCDQMTEDVINLRRSGVEIHFEQLTGLRIDSSYLRFVDNRKGVFVLDDNVVRFRLVEPVYEESGFLLSTTYLVDSMDKDHVKLFDQIIVKGTDLHDGKPIQNH